MLVYSNTFDNVKTYNSNFPVEDQFYASENEAIVADGITRDPTGISDLSTCSQEEFLARIQDLVVQNWPLKRYVKHFQILLVS